MKVDSGMYGELVRAQIRRASEAGHRVSRVGEFHRSAGATLGIKLRRFCNGVRFRIVGF